MIITENSSPSGNCVTIEGGGMILARVKELVTVTFGGNDQSKGFTSLLVTVTTTVASIYAPGIGTAIGASVGAVKAGAAIAGGLAHQATNNLLSTPKYSETSETMNINEFRHKYLTSGEYPISLKLIS
ncbi:MAG: hypothetical protein NY202_05810 [Mollicutes bacterium UO1]